MKRVNRALRYINALAALILLAALIAAYWFLGRPMPQVDGTLQARVSATVVVERDSLGVAHIRASTIEDALFAQGYVTAQDRLWQMDAIRRLASGELAEVIGTAALESDKEARRLRLKRTAEDHIKTMSETDRKWIAAYTRGVNDYIDQHRSNLPAEFRLMGYQPKPWSMADSIVVSLQMHRILTTSWQEEVQKAVLIETGDRQKVEMLFPVRSGREEVPGSNAWAISGKHTASGKPILANDPHLEFAFPSTWYQIHLKGGDMDVTGVTLPGVPAIIVGHNQRIAWGVTNLGFDVQDLYIEKINPVTGQYLFEGKIEQARREVEQILVKDGSPEVLQIWVTRHGGAVINDRGKFLALKWTATQSGDFHFPFVDLNRAQNWTEFRDALRRFAGPGQNFVYADVDGNIGYQATGFLPIRRNFDGDVPLDGASGQFEWQGYIPFEELPSAFNPPSGMIITGNQNPWPVDTKTRVSGEFAPPYRFRQIKERLEAKDQWKPADMLSVQTDIYSEFLKLIADHVVKANPPSGPAVNILREWNGLVDGKQAAPLITTLTFQHLRRAVAEKASPRNGAIYNYQMSPAVIENLLRNRPADWFPDWNAVIRQAFADALEEGQRMQGTDVTKWRWGKHLELNLGHPVLSRIPWAGKYFRIAATPMSGSSTTVKQTTNRIGPSMRFIADLSDWDQSLNNLTIGQSDHIFSGHFKDQWPAYLAGISFPMQYNQVKAEKTLRIEPSR